MQNSVNIIENKERIIQLPKILDERGNLSFIEGERHIPFKIARSYWIYDVPGGETRGSHAFREQEEFIIALSGSFDVVLDDGKETRKYSLNRSYMGLYVPPMTWRTLENFSTNSVCLVLSSLPYEEEDYIREYEVFKGEMTNKRTDKITTQIIKPIQEEPILAVSDPFKTTVYNCEVFQLPKIHNKAGNLTAVNNLQEIPYHINRLYYTYDIPSGSVRGGHAHKDLYALMVAASSSFDILLDDGKNKKIIHLDRPDYGLLIPPGIWRELINFSSGAICMVLASEKYIESDYLRSYEDFLAYKL